MPRTTPSDRLPKLLHAAAATFVELGFRRAQMDDVAERLGVSKGTLYRAVDSKEALFAAVVAWADQPDCIPDAGLRRSSSPREVAAAVARDLADAVAGLELTAIVANRTGQTRRRADVGAEVERVATGLFRVMHARRTAIMVLDRCAAEVPELSDVWFSGGRYALVDLWDAYLRGLALPTGDDEQRAILARTIVEIVSVWAVKVPWDPAPRPYPADTAEVCAAMISHLVTGGIR